MKCVDFMSVKMKSTMHYVGCPIEVSKVKQVEETCSDCGYDQADYNTIKHSLNCSHKMASEEPTGSETDDKCGDESCSICYPQHAGKE